MTEPFGISGRLPHQQHKQHLEVLRAAGALGIDLANEPHFRWLAEAAANSAELSGGWVQIEHQPAGGSCGVAYYHSATKRLQLTHPVLDRYRILYQQMRVFAHEQGHDVVASPSSLPSSTPRAACAQGGGAMKETQVSYRLGVLLDEMMNRCHKSLPAVTPEVLERVCLLCYVNTRVQCGVVRAVKDLLEDFVEDRYMLSTVVGEYIDPTELLAKIRHLQVRLLVLSSEEERPEDVVMCQECDRSAARLKCLQCKDSFCDYCFKLTHATGKRRSHATQIVEQIVCGVCQRSKASCGVTEQEADKEELYCDPCYEHTHLTCPHPLSDSATPGATAGDLGVAHSKRYVAGLKCQECDGLRQATLLCETCTDLFCDLCHFKLHRKGKRRFHVVIHLREGGAHCTRGDTGETVPSREAERLIDRARYAGGGAGSWLAFSDDHGSSYWFHYATRSVARVSPYAARLDQR